MSKKLCIAAYGDPTDPKIWSGTPLKLWKFAVKRFGVNELEKLDLKQLCQSPYYNIFYRMMGKFVYQRGTLRDPTIYQWASAKIGQKLHEMDAERVLFVAEHSISASIEDTKRYYVYLDSLMRPYVVYGKHKKPFSWQYLNKYEKNDRSSFERMDGIFTLNEWSRKFLIEQYGVDEKKIANVGFGINAQFYEEEKDYNNHLMLIVLRKGTEYVKGLYLLLDAFEKLKKRIPDAQLAVVGTECRAINGVQYYYNQPREKTLGLFRECTLYVMPNILEPNGITYLEALANKAPIVGLDRFSVPEFSGYGKWGFYIKDEDPDQLADLLEEALSNPKRLEVMGLQGQKFVHERYTWDQTASEIWERMF